MTATRKLYEKLELIKKVITTYLTYIAELGKQ